MYHVSKKSENGRCFSPRCPLWKSLCPADVAAAWKLPAMGSWRWQHRRPCSSSSWALWRTDLWLNLGWDWLNIGDLWLAISKKCLIRKVDQFLEWEIKTFFVTSFNPSRINHYLLETINWNQQPMVGWIVCWTVRPWESTHSPEDDHWQLVDGAVLAVALEPRLAATGRAFALWTYGGKDREAVNQMVADVWFWSFWKNIFFQDFWKLENWIFCLDLKYFEIVQRYNLRR